MDTLRILTGEDEVVAAIRALSDESRRQILHALRARRMSTRELCAFLQEQADKEVKPQTVRYHLKELEKSGLIEQDGYAPAGNGDTHIMKKLWRATAENIFIATGDMTTLPERPTSADIERGLDLIGTMKQLGFDLDETEIERVATMFEEWESLWMQGRELAIDALKKATAVDPFVYTSIRRVLGLIKLDEESYKRYWEVSRTLTDNLRLTYKNGAEKNPRVY